MMILVATIEHSGTHRLLEMLGWKENGTGREVVPLEERDRAHEDTVLFAHLYDSLMPAILRCADEMTVITTFRPAFDIRDSWIRRQRDVTDLDRQILNHQRLLLRAPYVLTLGKRWP